MKQTAVTVLAGLFASAALIVAWRRAAGALVDPLPTAVLMPAGVFAGALAQSIRTLCRRGANRPAFSRAELILDALLGGSLLVFAAALSVAGTNRWGLAGFWLFIAAEELWAWLPRARRWIARLWRNEALRQFGIKAGHAGAARTEARQTSPPVLDQSIGSPRALAKHVTQQLTRSVSPDGCDMLAGWLRMEFAARQRIGNLHVSFCPPFAHAPQLTAAQIEGPEARIKVAQLLPYGARLELKLVAPREEPSGVLVQFCARAKY